MRALHNAIHRARAFAMTLLGLLLVCLPLHDAALGQGATGQSTIPPPAAPRSVAFPRPVERTLKNGLRVIAVELSNMPLVTAQVIIKSGGEVDPPQLSGLADITASLLTKGTNKHSAPEIAQAIEILGGTLDSGAGWDASHATVNVMSSKINPAIAILAEVVRSPTFSEEEIERLRQQNIDALSVSLRQPGTLASFVASRVIFGDAPYGHPVSGTPESMTLIKRADILRLHSRYYRPNNAILVIGGDIKAEAAFNLAERAFGDWTNPQLSSTKEIGAEEEKKSVAAPNMPRRVVVVDMPEAGQAAVVLARKGLRRTDSEYFRGLVANSILGGGYSSRLNQEVRIKRGLSYGAGSSLSVRRDVGPFTASTQTKNESGAEVAELFVGELERLATSPIPETEIIPRKAVLIGNFARSLELTSGLISQVGSLALYGLSTDQINTYINNVQAVSVAEVQKFAAERLNAKEANIIIVGNAGLFLERLRKQFPNVEVIPYQELDLNSASLRKREAMKGE
jgi:zinc protease